MVRQSHITESGPSVSYVSRLGFTVYEVINMRFHLWVILGAELIATVLFLI